jgi:aspartate/methionine/tyrosine aminotransferase
MAIQILGLNPIVVDTDKNYHIVPELLEKKITKRTRAIIVVSPSNPTGAMTNKETWREIIRIARKYGIYIISDEPYLHFTWEKEHISPVSMEEEFVIGLWSFSKSYGMSGWRIGWMKVPNYLVPHIIKVADTLHVCTPVPSQILAEEIMKNYKNYPLQFLHDMKKGRDILIDSLKPLKEKGFIDFPKSEGGFCVFINLKNVRYSGWEIVKILIDKYGIATVPGEAFGMESGIYLRLSFGNMASSELEKASEILKKSLLSLLFEKV